MNSTQNVARFLHLARIIVDAKHFGIIIADINALMIIFSLKKPQLGSLLATLGYVISMLAVILN